MQLKVKLEKKEYYRPINQATNPTISLYMQVAKKNAI